MRHINVNNLPLLGKGEAYTCYDLDETRVFRVRHSGEMYLGYAKEQKLLAFLNGKFPVFPILLEYNDETEKDWGIYTKISGVALRGILPELSDSEKKKIIQELYDILCFLHSISLEDLASFGYTDDRFRDTANMTWLHKDVDKKISPHVPSSITQNIHEYIGILENYNYPIASITHGDVSLDNIMIDTTTKRISGLIDFSDSRVSDLALDYGNLGEMNYLMNECLEKHLGTKEAKYIIDRSDFYNKRGYIFGFLFNFKGNLLDDLLREFAEPVRLDR